MNQAPKDPNPKDAIGSNKVPLHLLSPVAKAYWAMAQFLGATKYGSHNFRCATVRASVYIDAAMRHFDRYNAGEELDPVDGTHHLGNAMACCAIILDARAAGTLIDDRPPRIAIVDTYEECEKLILQIREQYKHLKPKHYVIVDSSSLSSSIGITQAPELAGSSLSKDQVLDMRGPAVSEAAQFVGLERVK